MPRLILCADDFAFSTDTSHVIAELAADRRLTATGCMAVLPNWTSDARLLDTAPDTLEVGLHLVLTLEAPATAAPTLAPTGILPTVDHLQRAAARGTLPLAEIAAEIAAQFDRFESARGRAPAFVDGHQHAHALKGVREIVLDAIARRAPRAWVRTCADTPAALLARPFRGKALASAVHSLGLRRAAAARGIACNDGFAGHYDFARDYDTIFPAFLHRPGERHLVMCHPGTGARAGDAIAAARVREATALRRLPIAAMAGANGLAFPG
ncbi:ChbG/HpnK family deacetylase [uncultured Sphingomonas sp.]|uniref:ChbG/HpnK family deacetylase n=1 Tax=uncultured Sphingomonas sp. TaxID=158754 RepID=UPI0035CBEC65